VLIPDHETEVDFLKCEAISKTVVQLLRDSRKRALTIGIHGDWGAGKSSILKMVQSDLSHDKDVAVLWFNGWAFQGFDDAKTVMIEATVAELTGPPIWAEQAPGCHMAVKPCNGSIGQLSRSVSKPSAPLSHGS